MPVRRKSRNYVGLTIVQVSAFILVGVIAISALTETVSAFNSLNNSQSAESVSEELGFEISDEMTSQLQGAALQIYSISMLAHLAVFIFFLFIASVIPLLKDIQTNTRNWAVAPPARR